MLFIFFPPYFCHRSLLLSDKAPSHPTFDVENTSLYFDFPTSQEQYTFDSALTRVLAVELFAATDERWRYVAGETDNHLSRLYIVTSISFERTK